jgi:hypothetical protein
VTTHTGQAVLELLGEPRAASVAPGRALVPLSLGNGHEKAGRPPPPGLTYPHDLCVTLDPSSR